MSELQSQRETLLRTREKTQEVNTMTQKAGRILTGMARRAFTNKLIMWGIILLLLSLIGVVIYLNWFTESKTKSI